MTKEGQRKRSVVNRLTKKSGNPKTARYYLNVKSKEHDSFHARNGQRNIVPPHGYNLFFQLSYLSFRSKLLLFLFLLSFNNFFSPVYTFHLSIHVSFFTYSARILTSTIFTSSLSDPWREMLLGERRNGRTPLRGRRFAGRWHCGRARGVGGPRAPRRHRAQAPGTRQPRHFLRLLEEFNPYQTSGQGRRGRARERLRERDLREEAHFRPCTCSFLIAS